MNETKIGKSLKKKKKKKKNALRMEENRARHEGFC